MNRWLTLLLALLLAACASATPAAPTPVPTPAEPTGTVPSLATVGPSGGSSAMQTGENEGSGSTPVPSTGGELFVGQLDVPFGPGGRRYEYELAIPEAWRGRYEVAAEGANGATFFLVQGESRERLFTLLALTEEEWAAREGQPDAGSALTTLDGTVFVVQVAPSDAASAELAPLLGEVPAILQSFSVQRAPP